MPKSYIEPTEPFELQSRFSNEDALDVIPSGLDDEWKEKHLDQIEQVLDRLPEDEADILEQYFLKGKKQTNIAKIFGKTQAAISYNIKRALERVRFLVNMPDADKHDVFDDLREHRIIEDKLNAKIFAEIYDTSCQSKAANRLDLTQGRVRHRFLSNLESMGEELLHRLENWVENNIEDEYRTRMYHEDIRGVLQRKKRGEIENSDFEKRVRDLFHRLKDVRDYDLGDLGLLFEYYRTFVKIRHSWNVLRKIDLSTGKSQ